MPRAPGVNLRAAGLHHTLRMDTLGTVVLVAIVGFVGLSLGLQLWARRRAAALVGADVPSLPGSVGAAISRAPRALVYIFTPQCAACRVWTPKMRALADAGQPVFPVDAMQDPSLAQALSVMATPTTVHLEAGKVVGVHVGPVPAPVLAQFGQR